jgi:hypothetical protein
METARNAMNLSPPFMSDWIAHSRNKQELVRNWVPSDSRAAEIVTFSQTSMKFSVRADS